jgi:pilus assembly protein Flp/PilA
VSHCMSRLCSALRSEKGQTLVEYALILALVAVVVLVALTTLKTQVGCTMGNVANGISNAT